MTALAETNVPCGRGDRKVESNDSPETYGSMRLAGGASAHNGDDPCPLLPGYADREAASGYAGGQRRHGEDGADAGHAGQPLRRLHGGQRLSLIHI